MLELNSRAPQERRQSTPGQAAAPRTSLTQRLARFSAVHPWRVMAAWAVVLIASMAAIATLLGSALTTDAEITTSPDSVKAKELLEASFPNLDPVDEVVVIRSADLAASDPAFKAFVSTVSSSLTDTGATETVSNPYADGAGSAISDDGHAVAVLVTLGDDAEDGIVDILGEVDAADGSDGFDVAVSGEWTLDHDFNELSNKDLEKGEVQFGLPAALIVLLLVFGAVVAAFIPMGIAIVSIIVAVAASALVGQVTSLSFFVVNMITAMGLALGIDYSLFVLSRYREQRQLGQDKIAAIVATGGTASKAVLFSGSSFVLALLGLLLVPDTILRSLAFGAIIVGLITMVAALTLLPALLSLLGDKVNALRLPFVGRDHAAESPFWTRAVGAVVRRPAASLAAGVLILLALALPILDLRTGTAGASSLPGGTHSKAGFEAVEQSFPRTASSNPAQIVVSNADSPDVAAAIDDFQTTLADDPGFGEAQVQLSDAGDVALVSLPLVGDPDGEQARNAIATLRTDLIPAAFGQTDARVLVGGQTAENIDYSDLIDHWLPIVLAFVLGLSLVLLTVVFRSLVLSATAVVLNLLSVGAAYGLMVLVFQKGYGADLLGFQQVSRVEAWVPVFLFSVLFALSMDYHVFLLTRIRERYSQTGDTVDAVVHGIAATGRIITGAALIIVVVFAGFATGSLVMFQQMGFGVGVALLVDATLIRMVIVPAAMTVLGKWNWYLPWWLSWLPELHVEGNEAPSSGEFGPVER